MDKDVIRQAIDEIITEGQKLEEQAHDLVQLYDQERKRLRRQALGDKFRAGLFPRVRVTTAGTVGIYWENYKSTGAGKMPFDSKHIKANRRGKPYTREKLARYAEDWDIELVWETEQQFQVIREHSKSISAAVAALERLWTGYIEPPPPEESTTEEATA